MDKLVEITSTTAARMIAYLDSTCVITTLSGSGGVGGPHIDRKREVSRTPGEEPPRGLDNQDPGFSNLLLVTPCFSYQRIQEGNTGDHLLVSRRKGARQMRLNSVRESRVIEVCAAPETH